jgi:hypothetical protein
MKLSEWRNWRGPRYATFATVLALSTPLFGQSLDDYRKASDASGCGLIPYSSVWKDCEDAEREKERACAQNFRCGQELDKREREEIARRIGNGEACVARREAVAIIFARARDSLRNESVAERRPFASKSAERIENLQPGHRQAVEEANNAVFNCKQLAR